MAGPCQQALCLLLSVTLPRAWTMDGAGPVLPQSSPGTRAKLPSRCPSSWPAGQHCSSQPLLRVSRPLYIHVPTCAPGSAQCPQLSRHWPGVIGPYPSSMSTGWSSSHGPGGDELPLLPSGDGTKSQSPVLPQIITWKVPTTGHHLEGPHSVWSHIRKEVTGEGQDLLASL